MAFTVSFRDQRVLERAVDCLGPTLAGRSDPRIRDASAAIRIDATDVESTGQFARISRNK